MPASVGVVCPTTPLHRTMRHTNYEGTTRHREDYTFDPFRRVGSEAPSAGASHPQTATPIFLDTTQAADIHIARTTVFNK